MSGVIKLVELRNALRNAAEPMMASNYKSRCELVIDPADAIFLLDEFSALEAEKALLRERVAELESRAEHIEGDTARICIEKDALAAELAVLKAQVPDGYTLAPTELLERTVTVMDECIGYSTTANKLRDLFAAAPSPVQQSVTAELPPFARKIIIKVQRFQECAEDNEDVDIGRHWLELLTQLGLLNRVQRSPARWEMSQQGDDLLHAPSAPTAHCGVCGLKVLECDKNGCLGLPNKSAPAAPEVMP